MAGKIHTEQKCPICGGTFKHDENRRGLFCENHPEVSATRRFRVHFKRTVKRFSNFLEAERFLNFLRSMEDADDYDPRDYQATTPLGFATLAEKYLAEKQRQNLATMRDISYRINQAAAYFQNKNVKSFRKGDLREFLYSLKNITDKTRHNYRSTLHDFFKFLYDDEIIDQVPRFPEIKFELARRKILPSFEEQNQIIDTIETICPNPKVALGIDMLATYTILRPGDLKKITEGDIDLATNHIKIWMPTKRRPNQTTTIKLLPEHAARIKEIQQKHPATPATPFFRHIAGISGVKADASFGEKYFYKWWTKACQQLKIDSVPLYPGTRHTTTTELAKREGAYIARKASGHRTNKAFERYCDWQDNDTYAINETISLHRHKKKA